ncbi:MAG: glycosyltransferase family 2 protein [Kiritimatiellae bacterium]|nr:glycosyltransferase family 2 protein [Kiritimatiellia bacterium]
MDKVPVSVFVPVKNEKANIERCLSNLQWADEVFVVDSGSTDGTVELAEKHGAKVVQFHFNGTYPKKKNWALENLPFRNEWVLLVDADEVFPSDLQAQIAEKVRRPDADGYYVHFTFMFMGRPIRHCGYASLWLVRLFRHKLGRFERMPTAPGGRTGDIEMHEHLILEGVTKRLSGSVLHYAYPTIDTWVTKHNLYSNWEAELYEKFVSGAFREGEGHINRAKRIKRRVKGIYLRLPFRYGLRFLYHYILRLGFLDGKPGFIFSVLLSFYDFMAWAKVQERRLLAAKPG